MARIAGFAVLFAAYVGVSVYTKGWEGLAMLGLALAITALFAWAIGAIIYEDWWPFRHL